MSSLTPIQINPELDLVLERTIPLTREEVWAGWTQPGLLVQWFTPKPWSTKDFEIDVRAGGFSRCVMVSPEGEEFPNEGCILEAVPNERLVFTDALKAGFVPSAEPFFTGIIIMEDAPDGGTLYRAIARHGTAENKQKHEEMGFQTGWGQALDQLVELMTNQRSSS